jgi:hypothetical protein
VVDQSPGSSRTKREVWPLDAVDHSVVFMT